MTSVFPRATGRKAAVAVIASVVVVLAIWAVAYAVAGDRTPANATVLGVDIGGVPAGEAEQQIQDGLAERAGAPIPVTVQGEVYEVDPAAAGLGIDAEATVASTGTRSWNPVDIAGRLFGGDAVEPVVSLDEAALRSAVSDLAAETDREVRNGDVDFAEGSPVRVEPVAGLTLDQEQAADAVREAYLGDGDPVALDATETPPTVTAAEVDRAVAEFAEPATSGPVTLRVEGAGEVGLPAGAIASALDMVAGEDGSLAPVLDPAALREAVDEQVSSLEQDPENASWEFSGGRPVVVPAETGLRVDDVALRDAVLAALPRTGDDRIAQVAMVTAEPELSTAEAEALGIDEPISSFTQDFPYAAYRVQNIGTAARRIDGTVLLPGETFSMNDTTRERTRANGYTTGAVISGGRLREELGGGVSTITTAVWDAAFYAGLERVEQRAHSFYIPRYKAGLEATVAWGALDLRFRNDSPHGVYIQAESGRDFVTITMWGTKRYDIEARTGERRNIQAPETIRDSGNGCVAQGGGPGFDITVTRVFRQGGEVVREEPLRTSYNPADRIICTG